MGNNQSKYVFVKVNDDDVFPMWFRPEPRQTLNISRTMLMYVRIVTGMKPNKNNSKPDNKDENDENKIEANEPIAGPSRAWYERSSMDDEIKIVESDDTPKTSK